MAVLGTVVAINGTTNAVNEVTVVTEKGVKKQLHLNDTIQSGDTIVTPPGVIVELQLVNGKVLPIFAEQTVKFTPEFADAVPPSSGDSAVDQATIQAVIKAINEGRDIGDVLEETAAGIDGGSTTSYGFGFENLLRIVETLNPLAFQFDSRRSETLAIEPEFAEPDQNALPVAAGTGSTPIPGAPSVVVDIVDATLNVADTSSVVTFTFSEAPVGFVLGDITATNGTVTNLLPTGNPLVFTATFTANPGFEGSGSVSVAPGTYTNGAGTPGTGSSDTVGIDTAPPVPTITLDANITADDIINLAESGQNIPVTGTVGGDAKVGDTVTLTVNGNTYTGLVQAGLTFSILVPGADLAADPDSTIDASVTTTDAAGNSASATDTEGYSVNTGAPSVVVDIVDATLNVADTSSVVTFTFSEAPVGFVLGDITATNGTVTNLLPTGNPLVFTATFTANPGFEGSGSVSVAPGTYTNGAGTPGTGSSDTVGIDTAPPVPTITLDANITADDIINLAESGQNIPVTGTVGGDAKVGDTVTLTVNGNTYTGLVQAGLTFSILVPGADLAADPDSTIDASVTTTDAAGNSASATDTEGYSVNTGAPSVVVDIVDASLNVADTSSVVTFTFSEAPVGFVLGDITATNGTVTNLLPTGNPLIFTATFTANPGFEGSGSVSVAPGTYTNGAGTPGTGSSDTVGIDTAPPVPTITLDANITADDIINLAESGQNIPVTGTVGGDAQVGDTVTLTVNGNTYTGLVQAGLTFSILVPGADLAADPDSTIDASVTTTDAAGNSASATDTEGYSVNTGAPSVVVDIVDASLNVADTSSVVTFTFSEAPVGFVLGDITATNGTVTNLLPTGNPLVFTATFTANPGFEGSGSVSVAPGTYTNGAGTPGTGSSDTVGIDTAPPVPTITLDANITADDIINLAESGQNIPVTGTVGGDAKVGDTVTLTVNGNTYTGLVQAGLTFSILVPGADLAADPDSTIDASVTTTDAAGNSASATDTEGYSVNTGAPSVVVDIVDASLNVADTSSVVTFTFSEAPVGFVLGDITATNGTVTNLLPTGNPLVFTATFTANPGFEGSGSVSVAPGTYTNGAGTPGTGSSDTVGIDTAPPVPTITLDANITADDIINLAESGQNIPVTGTVGGDAKVGDTVTLTVNGNTYTGLVQAGLTFSILVPGADLVADPDSTIDASVTTTDAAGNSASATDTEGYSVNTGAPSVVVDIVDASLNVADTSSVVTFTFSEAPVGFVLGDITATNGTVTNLLPTGNPLIFTATFTANPGFEGSGSVSVAPGTYTNGAGTPGTGSSDTVGIDTAPPVPTISLDPNITADDIINLAESGQNIPVTGTVGGDAQVGDTVTLTVNGNTYTGLVQAGLTFSILVPGADLVADPDSTIDASVTTTDAAGNSATGTDTEGYSVNTGAPSVVVDIVDASLNVADTSSVVTFTFSEAPVGFVLGDITATNGTVTNLLPTGNPLIFTATFTANPGFEGSGSVSVAPGTYTNGAGTPGTGSSDTVGIDTAPPAPTISLDPNITADDIINLAESGQNIPVTGTVGGDAQVGDTVTLTVNGNTYTGLVQAGLTFSILVPGADLVADPDSTIDASVTTTDAAGNSATGTDTEGYSVNTGAPSVVVDIVDASLNVADTSSVVTFTFSEAPTGFTAADITAVGGTISGFTATANPLVYTATYTATPGFTGTGSVSVANNTYTDAAGNNGTGGSDTVPVDTAAPTLTVDIVDTSLNNADTSSVVTFTFSEAPTGFTAADITAVGGTISGFTATANPLVYTATYTATPGFTGTGSVSVANNTYTDAAGNNGTGGSDTVPVDTAAPTLTVDIVDTSLNNADTSSVVTFTFSEAPTGFTAADITAVGGTISGFTATANPLVYTATYTATPGFTGTGSVSVANNTYTDAAGNNGTGGSDTVPVDTAAPTLTVDIVDTSLNNADTSSVVTFTFSEAPTGFTAADITAVGGTISGFTATANPLVYTATYTATPGFTGTGSVSVANNTYTDAAGNNGTGGSDTVPVDTAAPTLTVDIVDTSLNNADTSSVVTFTFSEAPTGFTAADITAVGGTISGFTATANPLVYTATYTATPGFTGTGSVSVANNTYTDAAGNNGTGGSDTVPVDTAAPTLTVDIVDTSLNNADTSSVVTFTFSEAPTGFTAADITAVGGTISGFTATANPLVYTATYTATPGFTGTGSVSVANNTYTDAAGNNGTGGSDTVPVDTAAPTLTVDIVDTSLNNADTSSVVTFTFSEAPTGFTAADITAVGGTISGFTATANPLVYTATYTATPGFTGTGSVSVANNTYTDAAGNNGTGGSDTVPVDTAAPTLTVDIVDTSLNNADTSSVVTFTFSEAPTGFTAADITAVGGTISGFTATANPLVYTATYTATPGFTGTGSVSVANNTYTDAAGNNGTGGSDTVPVDTAAPTLTVDIVDTSLNNADTSSVVTFTFSEAPTGFTAADITAVGGTISGFTATANPLVYTATYTATPGFTGTGSVSVANNTYTDAAGNNGTGGSDTVPVDTAAPTLTVDIVDTSLNNADTSSVVTFTFSEAPTGFTAADITAVGGTISGFTATANPLVYTATYTATPGFTGTGSVSVANNTYTDAAGNNGTGGSDTVPVDTAAPTLTVDIVDTSLNNADTSSVVTFTFSEAPTGFTAADITAVGGTISGFTATANPLVYTATYTATPGFTGTGSVSVANNTYTDAAGNNGTGGSDTVPVDTAAPTLTVDIVDTSLNNADTSSVVTFTFSEAPTGFTAADITAVGGTISGFTATANPLVYTATYTATPGFTGTGSVSVANNTYTDAAGNNGTGGSDTVPVDTAAPVISAQTFSYAENQVTGATVATVVATDATIYRFAATGTNTSADGFYQISNAGVITITAAGVASGANNFETAPNSRNYNVTVLDAANNSSTATITLNETNVNETPVASADAYTSVEGSTTLKSTVLVNDTDPDGDTLTVAQFATTTTGAGALTANGSNTITTALGGTVVMNANGTYTYTAPARDHSDVTADVDTFAYRATDGNLNTAWVTVSITLTDTGPVANNDIDSVGIGNTVAGNVITGAGGVTADTLNVDTPHSLTNVTLSAGTQVSNTLGAGNVRTIVTTRGTLVIDQDDGSYTYTASVAPITVTNPTGVASFTAVGVNLYGFDTTEPYNTAGNVNSGLNLANLNATSAARARFQENAGEADDGVGAEQNAGDTNTNRTENGEQLVISLGVASKSTSIVLSNLFTGEVATWETYNAAGAIVSSGTTAGDADGLTNINISSGTAFSYVVVRSTGAASAYRVDGITVIPEPTGVTDVFTYTLRDGDGTTSSATLTMNYDSTTTTNSDTATVYESGINANGAQAGGTQEAQTIERATGNILGNDTGVTSFSNLSISGGTITGGTVTASAPDGNGVVTVTVTDTTSGSRAIATITVYTQNFGANVKGDYVVDLVGRTTDGAGTNDSFTLNYTLTNSVSGEVDNATLTVDVVDDVPTVQNAIVQVQTATLPDTNLVFVIDSSGSMDGEVKSVAADGTVTIMNRLQATQLAVAAVINEYFSQGGNISVTLIDFDATAADRGTYTTAASAIAALNNAANFAVGGGTNYEAALTQVMTSMGVVNTLENNTVYFISDGVPTVGDTTDPAANGYRNFITTNGINSYAIGIASDISNPTELNNIHNVDSDGSGVKDAAIIVTNVATLDDVLLASVPTSFGGSVAGSTATSSLNFGADGGYISSLVMRLDTNGDNVSDADVTFNYNPTTGQITIVGGGTPQTGFPLTSDTLTLNNANGFEDGILIFNFTTGEYTYQTAGFATEGEQFDINFVATDGDGDTASGKQTIQIVDGKPEANNDVDTLMGNATFFEGNVISAIGTDGGDSLQLTSFSTGRSGEDNPGDNGNVSSIVFKGVTFNLTALAGSTAALGGAYTVTSVGGVNTLTWTHATNGSSLVFNEEGYYRYAPPTAELSTNVTGASTNYTLTSAALVTTAATAGMTLTGIARTSAAEGSAAINTPNADGVGIVGNTNTRIDSLESLVITFDTSTHPHGVQGVTITVDTSNSNLGGTNAFNYNVYNVHGELIGQFASNLEGNVVLPAGLTGIGKIVIDAGGVGSYPGAFGSISAVRYSTILDTAGTPAPAAEVIGYTITDTDGDTSSATLTLNNIIDDIAGTSASNTINGTGRNENISGFAGDDTINAGAGYDVVRGGDGNDTIDGGANDDQLYGNAGNDTITGGTGKDQIYGDDGNDTLSGNDGDDYIDGGAGNDIINGGLGADIILGGAGNDTLTGGSVGVVDTFKWELADRGTTSAPATDTITDFDPLAAGAGGDVLDLRDLLTGESHVGVTPGNLSSYLHFEVVGGNTIIHISNNGGYSNGYAPTKDVQRITLTGVDLVQSFTDDDAVIQNLLTNNKLIVD